MTGACTLESRDSDGALRASLTIGNGTVAFALGDGRRGVLAPHFEVATGAGQPIPLPPEQAGEHYFAVVDSLYAGFRSGAELLVIE